MAITTSSVPVVFNTLADLLAARPGLAGVRVWSGPPPLDGAGESFLALDSTADEAQEGQLGNRRRLEQYTIRGLIWCTAAGADEATMRAVRQQAYAIQAELEDELRLNHHLSGTVTRAEFRGSLLDQGITGDGQRQVALTFHVSIAASLPTS